MPRLVAPTLHIECIGLETRLMLEDAILDSINVNRADLDRLKRMFEKGEAMSADLQAGVTWHIESTEHRIRELVELNRVLGQVSLCVPEGG